MILFKEAAALQNYLDKQRKLGKAIGFVPTMGALHNGHISLIRLCKSKTDITVCSIFVNPTQFNDPKDYEKYPITISNDISALEGNSCDILFLPAIQEIYPEGTQLKQNYDLGNIENLLEGEYRPGHFRGVCQVVHRLLNIVAPDFLFLGQKDYQQVMVIKRLIEIIGSKTKVITADTFREDSGLAMSSRNMRLSNEQRAEATAIYKTLTYIKNNYRSITPNQLEQDAKNILIKHGFNKIDYVSIADADTLQPVTTVDQSKKQVALIAATIGEVRLIDNMVLVD